MTSIALGGGPTVEARRDFAGLRDGSHIPGYQGYCPGIKYRVGKRYAQDTYELTKENDPVRHSIVTDGAPVAPRGGKPDYNHLIPDATGDNKYTKRMVPGYTGYVPRMPFKFGDTYKVDCDACIGQHKLAYSAHDQKYKDLQRSSQSYPPLKALKHDPEIKDRLNTFRDGYEGRSTFMDDRKAFIEPPIPGYRGFVPRIHTTELGLGCRYYQMTKNGLEDFQRSLDARTGTTRVPITIDQNPDGVSKVVLNRRLYPNGGMIPKYTGYIPQRKYNFGQTYGDTTRSLDVCAHPKSNFGEYMKTKPLTQSMA